MRRPKLAAEIVKRYPRLQDVPRENLIAEPTPVHPLTRLGRSWGHGSFYVKREDQTHSLYGGNKVRNLEYVLGDARQKGADHLVTLVPFGSNFTAALAVHGRRSGLQVHLAQFMAQRNTQIEAHAEFCEQQGARLSNATGLTGPVVAAVRAFTSSLSPRTYWVTPGASNLLGAMGHANAFLEMQAQVKAGLIPAPHTIVVGTGTCGTLAGLAAGALLAQSPVQLIGVRCAEKIVCHPGRVRRLASAVIQKATGSRPAKVDGFQIVDVPSRSRYAVADPKAIPAMRAFWEQEGISLDTTYTAKVGLFLETEMKRGQFRGRNVLYWHTYSPAVTCWTTGRLNALARPKPSLETLELSHA